MKIGLPGFRLSRKLLVVTMGMTVLLGGTGVTALYFGGKGLVVEGGISAIGGECTDIQTMVVKTPSNRLWLRRFIRMDAASGEERVRTALRIAGLLAKKNAVDLVHVAVLDTRGPTTRAMMRSRSIGAEVLIALKPENLPEMKAPAMASYYEGPVSDEGRFYGDRVAVDLEEIGAMMTAMRTIEEKPDCLSSDGGDEKASEESHGKSDKKEAHAAPAEHGEKPAEAHGKQAEGGDADADKDTAEAHGADSTGEQSLLDGLLGMVGLGADKAAPPEAHEPRAEPPADGSDEGHTAPKDAPADEHAEAAVSAHP